MVLPFEVILLTLLIIKINESSRSMYTVAAPRSIPNCSDRPNVAVPILLKRRIHATKMLLSIVKKLKS